jgi:hypothetical protein
MPLTKQQMFSLGCALFTCAAWLVSMSVNSAHSASTMYSTQQSIPTNDYTPIPCYAQVTVNHNLVTDIDCSLRNSNVTASNYPKCIDLYGSAEGMYLCRSNANCSGNICMNSGFYQTTSTNALCNGLFGSYWYSKDMVIPYAWNCFCSNPVLDDLCVMDVVLDSSFYDVTVYYNTTDAGESTYSFHSTDLIADGLYTCYADGNGKLYIDNNTDGYFNCMLTNYWGDRATTITYGCFAGLFGVASIIIAIVMIIHGYSGNRHRPLETVQH